MTIEVVKLALSMTALEHAELTYMFEFAFRSESAVEEAIRVNERPGKLPAEAERYARGIEELALSTWLLTRELAEMEVDCPTP